MDIERHLFDHVMVMGSRIGISMLLELNQINNGINE